MRPALALAAIACTAASLVVTAGTAGTADIDRPAVVGRALQAQLERTPADRTVDVIVRFSGRSVDRPPAGAARRTWRAALIRALRQRADEERAPFGEYLRDLGIERVVSLWLIDGLAFSATPDQVRRIARRPEIGSVSLDRDFRDSRPAPRRLAVRGGSAKAGETPEWNVAMIGAPSLWSLGVAGQGTVIAIVDSGVDAGHQDLASRWRGDAHAWFDPHGEHAAPYDPTGHGTAAAGILVGGGAGGTAIGVAPEARWIGAKIFDDAGHTSDSAIHQALQWALDPDGDPETDDAPDAVNNSWGLTNNVGECILEFAGDLETLKAAGIAVVFSAGNAGDLPFSSLSPANNPAGFAVGAADATYAVAPSSSRGPSACDGSLFPHVSAPGIDIWTTDLTLGGVFPDAYVAISGTSFAAPHVAGGMALLAQAFPEAPVAALQQAMIAGAADLGLEGPDNAYGHGLIDLQASYDWLQAAGGCPDGDGDGSFANDACGPLDCNDADPGLWGVPGEVRGLRLGPDHDTLSWDPPGDPGGAAEATVYEALRSAGPDAFDSALAGCLEIVGPTLDAADPEVPPPGTAWFYLVRARSACGSGPAGYGSNAAERAALHCASGR